MTAPCLHQIDTPQGKEKKKKNTCDEKSGVRWNESVTGSGSDHGRRFKLLPKNGIMTLLGVLGPVDTLVFQHSCPPQHSLLSTINRE